MIMVVLHKVNLLATKDDETGGRRMNVRSLRPPLPLEELTPWSRVLLEKLTGFQLVKKFPTFYGTRRFITAFTSARAPVPILSQLVPKYQSRSEAVVNNS